MAAQPLQYHVGVVSDTHGLLRPETLAALAGADLIIHAGDIGKPNILAELEKIAPVAAVRGNNDRFDWASDIPESRLVTIGGVSIHILHDLKQLETNPAASGHQAVISGHSHKPLIERRDGVLYLNPGSCGPRRFRLPVTAALMKISGGIAEARIVKLL